MRNKSFIISVTLCILLMLPLNAFASDSVFDAKLKSKGRTNAEISADSGYSMTTDINNSSFDAG